MSAKTPRNVVAGRRVSGSISNTITPVSHKRSAIGQTRRQIPVTLITTPECYVPISMGITPTLSATPNSRSTNRATGTANGVDATAAPVVIEENSSVVVAVRVRPLNRQEIANPDIHCIVDVSHNSIIIGRSGSNSATDATTVPAHRFTYDHCLCSTDKLHLQYADQQHTYDTVARPLLDSAFEGFNACLFAYGQTGSGKSYSIMGHDLEIGIIPRFGRDLFERIQRREADQRINICVEISYFEIYNEKIHDLLAPGACATTGSAANTITSATNPPCGREKRAPMRVREHPVLGPYVEDLSTFGVPSYNDLMGWLTLGNKQRATAATGMNDKSSRSHSVLTLVVTQTSAETVGGEVHEHSRKSRINIVDLAGSERVAACHHQATVADVRVREGISINQSLLTLGKVISGLAEASAGKSRVFVPYRESVLTWLLKESLGGNSKTTMLATVSPANVHVEDTLNTLRYAHQARSIVNLARVNEDPKARLIRELIAEIEKLRGGQPNVAGRSSETDRDEVRDLQRRLAETEEQRRQEAQSWMERLQESKRCRAEEADRLRRTGIAFQIDNKLPNLVNLNEDPQLAETLLYLLSEGDTLVGRGKDEVAQSIRLQGSLIQDNHCTLKHKNGVVTLVPCDDGRTFVNGHLISTETRLNHGDRLVLGGNHYFRFNNPLEAPQGTRSSLGSKDFVFAHSELLRVQDAKMKEELDRARERTRQEMLHELDQVKREADFELSLQKHGFERQIKELQLDLEEQNKEIRQTEQNRLQLELKNKELQREVQAEKVVVVANDIAGLRTLKTDYLTNLVSNLMPEDQSVCSPSVVTSDDLGPFALWLLLEQVNSMCGRLELPFTFCRHDRLTENGLESVVKVVDDARGLMLELAVDRLRGSLDTLQRMADGEKNLRLFDVAANWKPDEHLPLSFSPKVMESIHADPDLSQLSSFRLTDEAGRTPTSQHNTANGETSGIRRLIRRSLVAKPPSPTTVSSAAPESQIARESDVYRRHSAEMIGCFTEMCSPTVCVDIAKVLLTVVDLHRDARESSRSSAIVVAASSSSSAGNSSLTGARGFVPKLSTHLSRFLLHAAKLSSLLSLRGETGNELSDDYVRSVETLANLIVRLMERVEAVTVLATASEDGSEEDGVLSQIDDAVYQCCELIGQISASTGISLPETVDDQEFNIEPEIAFYFLCGLETVTGNALQTAVLTLEDCQLQMEILASDSFFGTMKDSTELVQTATETVSVVKEWATIYNDVHKMTSKDRENDTDHLVSTSSQAQQLVINFCALTEAVQNLHADVETFTKGEHVNFSQIFDSIAEIRGSVESLVSHIRSDCKQLTKKFQECLKRITTSTHKTKRALHRAASASASKNKNVNSEPKGSAAKSTTNDEQITTTHKGKSAAVVTRKIAAKPDRIDVSSPLRLKISATTPTNVLSPVALCGSPRGAFGYVDVSRSPVSVEHSPGSISRLQSTSVWSSTMSPGSRDGTPAKSIVRE